MLFRQLFDPESSSYSYLIADADSKQAALIDSVYEQTARDTRLIQELGLELKYLLETHVHADHVTGIHGLKENFPKAQSVLAKTAGVDGADLLVADGGLLELGSLKIQVISTPGHTAGCTSYYVEDRVFTGDTLLIRGCGRTDFQQGDAGQLYDSVTQKLFSLPEQTLVYPGHNYQGLTASSIGEEKRLNPRLAQTTRQQFIELMNQLNLPYPKKIDTAVPANLKCGNLAAAISRGAKHERD